MKRIILFLLAISQPTFAQSISISASGQTFTIPLPDGFCNVTEGWRGISTLDYLAQVRALSPELPRPVAVFEPCVTGSQKKPEATEIIYPWIYVGVNDLASRAFNGQSLTQEDLNSVMTSLAKDGALAGLSDEYFDGVLANVEATQRDLGYQTELEQSQGFVTVHMDDNVVIGHMIGEGVIDGQKFREQNLFTGSVVNGTVLSYYFFSEIDNSDELQRFVDVFADLSAELKAVN